MAEPLAQYRMLNYNVVLYQNRVEILQKIMPLVPAKTETIPVRSIASVNLPFGKRLEIRTNDGKRYIVNLAPADAKDLRNRLLDLL